MSSTPALDKFNEEIRKRYGITPEQSLQEMERLRSLARHNEASALRHARKEGEQRGEQREREKWQGVVADISTKLAGKDAENEKLRLRIAELQAKAGD